jgi:D-alanine-D-alanine ligase
MHALAHLADWPADVVMPVLHGRFGEDGTLQACLAAAGLPFVGSGSLASALANDKIRTKEILSFHGVPTPRFEVLDAPTAGRGVIETARRLLDRYGAPLVLKDPCGGSSLEVHIADDEGEVAAALERLGPGRRRILVEAHVPGRELTSGVLEDRDAGEARALPIVEIRPRRGRSFDYHEKYSAEGAQELCPAPLEEAQERAARNLGLAVHRLLGLRGLSRTDLILDGTGALQVLEVNTLPGMTERGLVPLAAKACGISFPALIERLVRTASAAG